MKKNTTTRLFLKVRAGLPLDNFVNQDFRNSLKEMGLKELEPVLGLPTNSFIIANSQTTISEIFKRTLFLEFEGILGIDTIINDIKKLYGKDIVYIEEDVEIVIPSKSITKILGEKKLLIDYPLETINYNSHDIKGNGAILAIIDSGVNYNHFSLKNSLWSETSSGESYGINLTNDGNRSNVIDTIGHGTMVAGIVGAYNNANVTGLASSVKILSIKVFPKISSKSFVRDACIAMVMAYCNGARVINNSWELLYLFRGGKQFLTETLSWLEKNNCLVVFAAGNRDRDCKEVFPQNLQSVISVGAINEFGKREIGTNWGNDITIWAPGSKITSLSYIGTDSECIGEMNGTSIAAPFISAVLALLKTKNPSLSLKDAKKLLRKKGTPISISANSEQSYLLNFSKTLNINPSNNLKTNNMKTSYPKPPENKKDINQGIFTFLHLERGDIFHLLHNEVDLAYISQFQIFGCFKGNKVIINNEEKFLVEEVALKLVNLNPKSKVLHKIDWAEMVLNSKNEVDFRISTVQTKKSKVGIDHVLKQLFLLNFDQVIDYHVNEKADHNGIPCNQVAFF